MTRLMKYQKKYLLKFNPVKMKEILLNITLKALKHNLIIYKRFKLLIFESPITFVKHSFHQ